MKEKIEKDRFIDGYSYGFNGMKKAVKSTRYNRAVAVGLLNDVSGHKNNNPRVRARMLGNNVICLFENVLLGINSVF